MAAPAFHLYWSFLPQAAEALEAIARFVDELISRSRPTARTAGTRPD